MALERMETENAIKISSPWEVEVGRAWADFFFNLVKP
jgi:hypothetical protein